MTTDQDQDLVRIEALEVSAFRYSADPPAVAEFLQLLGLSLRVSNSQGSWLELQAAAGSVSLHATDAASAADAEPGKTDLVLIAQSVPAFAAALADRDDVDVTVWDEAFGHQAEIVVGGRKIIINELQPDPYGYQVRDPTPGPVTVVSHCFTADFGAAQEMLAALGFRAMKQGATVRFESATASTGVIVLHRSDRAEDRYRVGFETVEDLTKVAGRLRAAGFASRPTADGNQIEVTDPDRQPIFVTRR